MPPQNSPRNSSARPKRRHGNDSGQAELGLDALSGKIQKMLSTRPTDGEQSLAEEATSNKGTAESIAVQTEASVDSHSELPQAAGEEPPPMLPVRRLHNFAYCPRLFYFQWVENLFVENADTAEGSAVHRQTDKPWDSSQDCS